MLNGPAQRWGIRYIEAITAFTIGIWVYNIAAFKIMHGLSSDQLALLLLIAPVSSTITFIQGPRLSRKLNARTMTKVTIVIYAFAVLGLSTINNLFISALILSMMGVMTAIFEISTGAIVQKIDLEEGPILSSCHGAWSVGIGLGAFIAGFLTERGLSFQQQMIILIPEIVIFTLWSAIRLPVPQGAAKEASGLSIPNLALLPLCLLPFAGLFVEGSIAEWNTIFLRDDKGWSDIITGSVLSTFMAGMAISRFLGDPLRLLMPAKKLFVISVLLAMFGQTFYALSNLPMLTLVGALFTGLGVGIVYPITLVLGSQGRREDEIPHLISAISLISFNAFLIGPVFMGLIDEYFSLTLAFVLMVPLLGLTFLWLRLARI